MPSLGQLGSPPITVLCFNPDGSPATDVNRNWVYGKLHVEITTGIAEATAIPWELIRNPDTGTNLALSAQAFVRTQQAAQLSLAPRAEAEKVRIILVICRPKAGKDVHSNREIRIGGAPKVPKPPKTSGLTGSLDWL
jgi:hypothetical protein